MRYHLIVWAVLLFTVCAGFARDITTISGKTYQDARVTRVDRSGIAIVHRDGAAFIPFSDLPPETQAEFAPPTSDPDAVAPSSAQAQMPELATLDGNNFRDVRVVRIERTGIRIYHRNGAAFVDYMVMPVAIRLKFGFTESSYAAGKLAKQQREASAAEAARQADLVASAQQAEALQRRREAALAPGEPAATDIASRDYSTRGYSTRGYDTPRYSSGSSSGGTVQVSGYFKKNGTYVHSYSRRK